MKKIVALICTGVLCASLVACGGEQGADNELLGTWQPESVVLDGSTFTIKELEAMGDDSLSEITIVIKDGGKAYIEEGANGELVDWEITDEGILLGEIVCPIDDEYIILENNGVQLYLEKTSDEQVIAEKEQSDDKNEEKETVVSSDAQADNEILVAINSDVNDTISNLNEQYEVLINTTGSTFEEYQENKAQIDEFYSTIQVEMKELGNRMTEQSLEYFRYVVEHIDNSDTDAIDNALEEYYDEVYDGACDELYEGIYDDLMEDLYDAYYDGVLDDAYDTVEYETWSDASSEAYEQWSDTSSNVYEIWSDISSLFYDYWSDVNGELVWDENFDIESIISNLDEPSFGDKDINSNEQPYGSGDEIIPETEIETSDTSSDTEWKQFLDDYEAWVDEYIIFMEKYAENPTDLTLLTDYTSLMTEMVEWAESAENMQDDLSGDDLVAYMETMTSIVTKLNEAMLSLS